MGDIRPQISDIRLRRVNKSNIYNNFCSNIKLKLKAPWTFQRTSGQIVGLSLLRFRVRVSVSSEGQLLQAISGFSQCSGDSSVSPISSHQHSPGFNPPTSCHFLSSFTSFKVRKRFDLAHHRCIIMPVFGSEVGGEAPCVPPLDSEP